MDKAIIVDHLSYQGVFEDVSFTIQKGEFVGIIDIFSSVTTSILKTISGLIKPTSGFVSVLGYDPFLKPPEFLKQIAFLPEQKGQLLKNSPAIDVLETTKEIYGLSDRDFHKNLSELTKFTVNPNLLNALIYKPTILLLDETNIDLDSVYEYNKRTSSTVLFSAKKLDDLVNLVRRVIILDKGKLLFDGAIDEIITKFAVEKNIRARLSSVIDIKSIEHIGTVKKYVHPDIYISVPRSVVSFATAEMMQNFPIFNLNIEELPIEEIIQKMKS